MWQWKLLNSDQWDVTQELICGESAGTLAFSAKEIAFFGGIALLCSGPIGGLGGAALIGGSEALYTGYSGGCSLLGYNVLSMKYDRTTKLAHSLLQYNASWPSALNHAVLVRNRIIDDITTNVTNYVTPSCSNNLVILSADVQDVVCADFINQFVNIAPSITIKNNDVFKLALPRS